MVVKHYVGAHSLQHKDHIGLMAGPSQPKVDR